MSTGYLEQLQELVAKRSTDYRQMGQLVSLANLAQYQLERQIVGLNHELATAKKRLAVAVHLLNETDRADAKLKCWEFPAGLYIRVCEFIGKGFTRCEGGAK